MPRGKGKRGVHKGKGRHFTNAEELKVQDEKERKEKEWKKKQGIESDESESEGEDGQPKPKPIKEEGDDGIAFGSESETDSEEDEDQKAKGVSHLIDIANPNRAAAKQIKKVTELDAGAKTQLSRREREELEKQQAKAHYQKLHLAGKTDEARADLARLAIIRQQRDEQQKKRDEEKKQRDAEAKAAENRLKEKRAARQ